MNDGIDGRHRRWTALVVVGAVVISSGCQHATGAVVPAREPCGLVSTEQAQQILGMPALTATPDLDDLGTCDFASDRGRGHALDPTATLDDTELGELLAERASIQLSVYPSATEAADAYGSADERMHAHPVQLVKLGDAAVCASTFTNFRRLAVRVGCSLLTVTAPSCESATALASIAVTKLRRSP